MDSTLQDNIKKLIALGVKLSIIPLLLASSRLKSYLHNSLRPCDHPIEKAGLVTLRSGGIGFEILALGVGSVSDRFEMFFAMTKMTMKGWKRSRNVLIPFFTLTRCHVGN